MISYIVLDGGHRRVSILNKSGSVLEWTTKPWADVDAYDGPKWLIVQFDDGNRGTINNDGLVSALYEERHDDGNTIRRVMDHTPICRNEPKGIGRIISAILTATANTSR